MKVEGEKNYHLRIAAILSEVEAEVSLIFRETVIRMENILAYVLGWNLWQMVSEKQRKESAPPVISSPVIPLENVSEKTMYFLAEVSFQDPTANFQLWRMGLQVSSDEISYSATSISKYM